jgi:predicted ATPase
MLDQASAWLGYVFDGGTLKEGPASESVLTLLMNSDGYVRPVHMGFGFSYVLPILVAGLVAEMGSMLIVENPEAHLHPLAQSRLGEFLAQVAATGVQVFVESHSEHILNAFRLAVRSGVLAADALSVLYFRGADVDPVLRIPVDERGGIAAWPEGFFDQRLHDFARLFGV